MEESWTNSRSETTLRFSYSREVVGRAVKCRHVLEDLVLSPPLDVVRITNGPRPSEPPCRVGLPESDQTPGVLVGERFEKNGVSYAEHRCVGADPERESQHRDGSEAGVLGQHTQAITQILEKCRHGLLRR